MTPVPPDTEGNKSILSYYNEDMRKFLLKASQGSSALAAPKRVIGVLEFQNIISVSGSAHGQFLRGVRNGKVDVVIDDSLEAKGPNGEDIIKIGDIEYAIPYE
jgi:hypothetical protein